MSRSGRKRIWIVAGLLVGLLLIAVVALPFLVDLERHRPRIESALRDATGWEPRIGEMSLSILGGLAVDVRPASLRSPDGSSVVEIDALQVSAALFPLLRGQLAIEQIEVRGPSIELVRVEAGDPLPLPIPIAPSGDTGADTRPAVEITIDRVAIRDGQIRILDRSTATPRELLLDRIRIDLSPASGTLEGEARLAEGSVTFEGDGSSTQLSFAGVSTALLDTWAGPGLLRTEGTLDGSIEFALPLSVHGDLEIQNFGLTSGESTLPSASIAFRVEQDEDETVRLTSLTIAAGAAQISGSGTIQPVTDIDLEMPDTPLAPALALARSVFPLPLDLREPGSASLQARLFSAEDGSLLHTASGKLVAAELALADYLPSAKPLRASYRLDETGALRVELDEARLAGGQLTGGLSLDSVDPPGILRCQVKLEAAELELLLAGLAPSTQGQVTGRAHAALDVGLDLSVAEPGLDALSGSVELRTGPVDLPGWDLQGRLEEKLDEKLGAIAALLGRGTTTAPREPTGQRAFDELQVTIDMSQRPFSLRSFSARNGELSLQGGGTFDPGADQLDLDFQAQLDASRSAEWVAKYRQLRALTDSQGRITVPLQVDGSIVGPGIGVDTGQLLLGATGEDDTKKAIRGLLRNLIDDDDD